MNIRLQLTGCLDLKSFPFCEEKTDPKTTAAARACHALTTIVLHDTKLRNFSLGNSIFPPAHGEQYPQVLPGGCTLRRGYNISRLDRTFHTLRAILRRCARQMSVLQRRTLYVSAEIGCHVPQ